MDGTPNIAFIGGGNMAEALVGGLLKSNRNPAGKAPEIHVVEPDPARREVLNSKYRLTCHDAASALTGLSPLPAVLVLATKPQVLESALHPLRHKLAEQQLLLSVAAGTQIETIRRYVDAPNQPVVRAMPNTPSLVGAGVAGLFAPAEVSQAQRDLAEQIVKAAGTAYWVETEQLLDAVTAISGSGPAYYFLFTEALAQAGAELGLERTLAASLAAGTALGAARLMQEDPADAAELRRRVTSPGGTTEQAIAVFEKAELRRIVMAAASAAAKRAAELAGK